MNPQARSLLATAQIATAGSALMVLSYVLSPRPGPHIDWRHSTPIHSGPLGQPSNCDLHSNFAVTSAVTKVDTNLSLLL